MKVGDMKQRILFLRPGGMTQNDLHEDTPVWIPVDPRGGAPIPPPFSIPNDCDRVETEDLALKITAAMRLFGVWANVAPMTGREYEEAQKIRAETTYKIKTRYFPGIRSDMRILFRGRIFRIESALEADCARREMQLICTEADAYGKTAD